MADDDPTPPPDRGPGAPARWAGPAGMAGWVALVVASVVVGRLAGLSPRAAVTAVPFYGRWVWHGTAHLWPVLAVGLVLVAAAPRAARVLPLRVLAVATGVASAGWAVAVAQVDGWDHVASPLAAPDEYLPVVGRIGSPRSFLSTFTRRAAGYPTHVKGHPPGATLLFWAVDRMGLRGDGWAAVVVLGAWAVGVAAVVWAAAAVGGSGAARRAAPFLVLLPGVVWVATTADALFAGVAAVGIALVVAGTGRSGGSGDAAALAGGVVLGLAVNLSYGLVALLVVPVGVALHRRRLRPLLVAAAGGALVLAGFAAAGFWWFDGLATTRGFYRSGLSRLRPYWYFASVGDLGAFAVAVGPAVGVGIGVGAAAWAARRRAEARATRGDAAWLLPALALAAVLLADLSGLSKAEVERIWLPFAPWVVLATAMIGGVAGDRGDGEGRVTMAGRLLLVAHVVIALGLQACLVTLW